MLTSWLMTRRRDSAHCQNTGFLIMRIIKARIQFSLWRSRSFRERKFHFPKNSRQCWNDSFVTATENSLLFLSTDFRFIISNTLEGISCVFLLLTLLVYACLPTLQNLHGKTLMCHSASLLVAFACLSIIPWVTPPIESYETVGKPNATKYCSILGTLSSYSKFTIKLKSCKIWRIISFRILE